MKIVFVCNEYPPRPHAGIGTAVHAIAHGLQERGHVVSVVGLGADHTVHNDGGIDVTTLRRSSLRYLGNLVSRIRLRRWLSSRAKRGQVDVIEVPDSAGLLPFRIDGCIVVTRLHNSFTALGRVSKQEASTGITFYERRTVATNRNWIAVSGHILRLTQETFGVCPKRSAVIYNPVLVPLADLPEVPGLPTRYILYAGHVNRRKGADTLAEAVRDMMARQPDLHLVYAGGVFSSNGIQISEHICQLLGPDLANRVHFLGHIEHEKVLACMKRASVFALPSRLESFGLVVVEAMSCGVPVVFTSNPPGPEIVEDGVTGLLADPTSPADIGDKIRRILDDRVLAKSLVNNAQRAVAERFSLRKCAEATEQFYQECLCSRQ